MPGADATGDLAGPGRVVRSLRFRASAAHLFLDPFHDPSRAVVVLGSARSGTTWLAQLLSAPRRTRLVLEPLHAGSPLRPTTFVWGDWRAPGSEDAALTDVWARVLSGSARSTRTDRMNDCRFATRRVVKCIAGTNLAGWLCARFPTVPVVYIVRHPFAAAMSATELASAVGGIWRSLTESLVDDLLDRSAVFDGPLEPYRSAAIEIRRRPASPFGAGVLRWCLENFVALTSRPPSGALLVRYEELLADPRPQLTAVGSFVGLDLTRAGNRLDRPSKTEFRSGGPVSRLERAEGWKQRLQPAELREGTEILEAFGLEGISAG
jgi:hypothetical protein